MSCRCRATAAACSSVRLRLVCLSPRFLDTVGGEGSEAASLLASFGFPRKFIEHGPVDLLYDKYGLSSQKIASDIFEKLKIK